MIEESFVLAEGARLDGELNVIFAALGRPRKDKFEAEHRAVNESEKRLKANPHVHIPEVLITACYEQMRRTLDESIGGEQQ